MPPSLKVWVRYRRIVTINLYGALTTTGLPIVFQYSPDLTNWFDVGSYFDSTSCALRGSFNLATGDTATVRAWDGLSQYNNSRTNNSTTCPGSPYTSCLIAVTNVTGDRNIAITVNVSSTC